MLVAWRSEVHGIIPLDPSAAPVRSQVELTSLASLLTINRLPDPVGVS